MARLQDFPTVTPTSSDKLLVVQSQSQGLVPYGSKLDSANPTGTGTLSMNRKASTTVGTNSATFGKNGTASGDYSFATGDGTTASGNRSFTTGANTTASGERSFATGTSSTASGAYSFAANYNTTASGESAHAVGENTIANHRSQFVFGEYNAIDDSSAVATARGNYVEIVGKGANAANRSNARTLDWSGNEVLAGDLTIKGDISLYDATRVITPTDITFTLATGVNLSVETLSIRRLGKLNIINLTLLASAVLAADTEIFVGTISGLLTGYSYIVGSMVTANDTKFQGGYNLNTANGRLYICPTNSIPSGYKLSMTINALSA